MAPLQMLLQAGNGKKLLVKAVLMCHRTQFEERTGQGFVTRTLRLLLLGPGALETIFIEIIIVSLVGVSFPSPLEGNGAVGS